MELLEQLDSQISTLLSTLAQLKAENATLRSEVMQLRDENVALEDKNRSLLDALNEEVGIRKQALLQVDRLITKIQKLAATGDLNE